MERPTSRQMLLLFALSVVAFLGSTNGISLSPFLLVIGEDLGTDLGAVSLVYTFSNITWAVTALAAGPLSDRLGRKPVMLVGMGLMAASSLGTALAQDYFGLAFWRFVTGLGGGTQMPTVFAAAAEVLPAGHRGKALGWVMTGQSLSLVLGPPLSALIGAYFGWRWAIAVLGIAGLAVILVLAWQLPGSARAETRRSGAEGGMARLLSRPSTLALFAASACERVCYSSAVIFLATYFIVTYGIGLQVVAGALVVVAIGNVAGSQLGGWLTDRVQNKSRLVGGALLATAVLALPLLAMSPGLAASVGLGLAYNLVNGLARPPLIWLVSELSRESRGALMGAQVTVSGLGWLTASSLGGWLVVSHGFGALGALAAVCGLASAACALLSASFARRAIRPAAGAGAAGVASS